MNQLEREQKEMQSVLGRLLQIGVGLSAGVVLLGACAYLLKHHGELPDYDRFHAQPESSRTVGGVVHSAFAGGRNLIQLGLLLLIATPVARVVFSVYTFAKEKDRLYTAFTIIVLALLLFSLFATR